MRNIIKTIFDIEWVDTDNELELKINPIRVVGIDNERIDAIDKDGRCFFGSIQNYFSTENDAINYAKLCLSKNIESINSNIDRLIKKKNRTKACLMSLSK